LAFQSSPGLVTGRYEQAADEQVDEEVSILARSGDRALPVIDVEGDAEKLFQSSPGLVTGRYTTRLICIQTRPGFNPRPVW